MLKKVVIILVLLTSLIFFDFWLIESSNTSFIFHPISSITCRIAGGDWGENPGVRSDKSIPFCSINYSDGGEACKSSKECKGDCVINIRDGLFYCERNDSEWPCTSIERAKEFREHPNVNFVKYIGCSLGSQS